jgi:hypothetical protein
VAPALSSRQSEESYVPGSRPQRPSLDNKHNKGVRHLDNQVLLLNSKQKMRLDELLKT